MQSYLDFAINFTPAEAGGYTVVASAPGGDARATFASPATTPAYRFFADRLARNEADASLLSALGETLFSALFVGEVRAVYAASRAMLAADQGLRLRLVLPADDLVLAALPWELLYDPDRGHLALLDMPVVRYLPRPERLPTLAAPLPLRVLLSGAQTPPPVQVERELAVIAQALTSLGDAVSVTIEPHLTATKLQERLREQFHIWHFVGHGALVSGAGVLLFEDEYGDAERVTAAQLGVLLDRSALRLVVLDACEGAASGADPFRSVAPALMRAQVPAVVAMRTTVAEETTRAFATQLYRAVASGAPLDACVTEGRRAVLRVAGVERADWSIPALFTRAADARLFTPVAAPPPTSAPGDGTLIVDGLGALARLMALPEVRGALVAFEQDIAEVRERVRRLTTHKRLHDLFQELESSYGVIASFIYESGRLIDADRLQWSALDRNHTELDAALDTMCAFAAGSLFASEGWVPRLVRAREDLVAAVADADARRLQGATRKISEVLGREPSRINTRMVEVAADLRLGALLRGLRTIQEHEARRRLDAETARRFAALDTGLDALAVLDTTIQAAVHSHNLFQEVDDELRRIEGVIDLDRSELAYSWQDLRPRASALCATATDRWAEKLLTIGADLDTALAEGAEARTVRLFRSYRSTATRGFNQVDHQLLDLCEELQRVGEPLTAVLRML